MKIQRVDEFRWRLPREGKMRVPGLVFASEAMLPAVQQDQSLRQVANVAALPGILQSSIAMPDVHLGYGFPIGGVAAFDEETGVLSPGGVGYDINCGVRLLRSKLTKAEIAPDLKQLSLALRDAIPAGVGTRGPRQLKQQELERVLVQGARWAVGAGYGSREDLECIEEQGEFAGADPDAVSERARERGRSQLGSLGSGNHFCELGHVTEIYDQPVAGAFGLQRGQITLLIHSGSRGLGHQVCDDNLRAMLRASARYGIELADRQLCSAPLHSPEAKRYFAAMACAVNFAFANRQLLTHLARQALAGFFGASAEQLGLGLVYDVCHNIAKWEHHEIDAERRRVCVHRKGATRAFPKGHAQVPSKYRDVGQPVLVPGDMGRSSYVLVGMEGAMHQAFGSSCHGAGRRLSRKRAKQTGRVKQVLRELEQQGIWVRSHSMRAVAEEIPEAYKDVTEVVDVVQGAGLARKVARLEPLAVVKG